MVTMGLIAQQPTVRQNLHSTPTLESEAHASKGIAWVSCVRTSFERALAGTERSTLHRCGGMPQRRSTSCGSPPSRTVVRVASSCAAHHTSCVRSLGVRQCAQQGTVEGLMLAVGQA